MNENNLLLYRPVQRSVVKECDEIYVKILNRISLAEILVSLVISIFVKYA